MLPGALALRPGAWRGALLIRRVLPALHLLPLPAYLPLLAHSTHPQRDNFDFFMTIGMGLGNRLTSGPAATDFVVVLSGQARVARCAQACRPCARLYPLLAEVQPPSLPSLTAEYKDRTGGCWAAA